MSKLLRVILTFDDKIMAIEGQEAEKWDNYNTSLAVLAHTHNMNPFDIDPIKWQVVYKEDSSKGGRDE